MTAYNNSSRSPQKGTRCPILVTGAHRTGTTWVGRILSVPHSVCQFYEPFNPDYGVQWSETVVPYWFTYIQDANQEGIRRHLERLLSLQFPLYRWKMVSSWTALAKAAKNFLKCTLGRMVASHILIKDPIALFNTEWIEDVFGARIVIMIRNPLGFAGSLKVKGWTFPFEHFLEQPKLMAAFCRPYENEIRGLAEKEGSIVEQAALLWKIIYSAVATFQKRHKNWLFVRHEDLCMDPIGHFEGLFESLELPFTQRVKMTILEYSDESNPTETSQNQNRLMRNSRAVINNWQNRLTGEEVAYVKQEVAGVVESFYSEDELEGIW